MGSTRDSFYSHFEQNLWYNDTTDFFPQENVDSPRSSNERKKSPAATILYYHTNKWKWQTLVVSARKRVHSSTVVVQPDFTPKCHEKALFCSDLKALL